MERKRRQAVGPYVVMAIPLLIEGGSRDRVDRILVVDVDEAVQLQRRDGTRPLLAGAGPAILASQASRSARLAAADDVLQNDGTVTDLRQAVDRLHENICAWPQQGPGTRINPKPEVYPGPSGWLRIGA